MSNYEDQSGSLPGPGAPLCTSCGASFPDHYEFCAKCGAQRTKETFNYCVKCGTKLPEKVVFCPQCGHRLAPDAVTTPTHDAQASMSMQREKRKKPATVIIVAVIALLVVGTYFGYMALREKTYEFTVTNQTGYTIYYLYVSPVDTDSWEEDLLGDEVLLNNASRKITLRGYKSPHFDIRLVDEDGDSYTFWHFDVSNGNLVVKLSDLD